MEQSLEREMQLCENTDDFPCKKFMLATLAKYPYKLGHMFGYNALTPLHGRWIHELWAGPKNRRNFLLLAHRGSYKTTAVIVGIIWYFIFWPHRSLLLVRKDYSGAKDIFFELRNHYRSKKMQELYAMLGITSNFHLTVDREGQLQLSTANSTKVGKEGNFQIASVYSRGLTGQHYDHIHLDDIVTEKDRYSKLERLHTERFFENLQSIVRPKGKITATGTPWHSQDLYSKFEHYQRYPIGKVKVEGVDEQFGNLLRQNLTSTHFSLQYHLQHRSEESLFFNEAQYTSWWGEGDVYGHIDAAYGGKDYTALTMVKVSPTGKLVVRGHLFSEYVGKHYETIVALLKEEDVLRVWMEKNADKGMLERDLRLMGVPTIGYHESMRKHLKIITTLTRYWPQIQFHYSCAKSYVRAITNYDVKNIDTKVNETNFDEASSKSNGRFTKEKNNQRLFPTDLAFKNSNIGSSQLGDDAPDSLASLLWREPLLKIVPTFDCGMTLEKNHVKGQKKDWKTNFDRKLNNFFKG